MSDCIKINHDVWLRDVSNQNLARFLMLEDGHVIGIPMTALYEAYRDDITLPVWVPPGCHYSPEGFLRYLAGAAAWKKYPESFSACSRSEIVNLTRQMQAGDLARLTGYDVEDVRRILREFLVFEPEPGDTA